MPRKPQVLIISPALANANNGNWQTAQRWARFLRARYRVECATAWDADRRAAPDLLIALHARRSASSIAAFAAALPQRPLVLILTGTDLYRDIDEDAQAQHSLLLASRLVVLQPAGLQALPTSVQHKACVIYQSAPTLQPRRAGTTTRRFGVIMIGHLREEKLPATYMQAAALVRSPAVHMDHIGAALEPALGILAEQTGQLQPRYRWLGALPHAQTRQRLRRSALMVLASRMEGGANVIIEAVTCGVAVLASDIPGNRGMLGDDYAGYFAVADAAGLASLIDRAATEADFLALLQTQCAARAALFDPARERAAVRELADNCLSAGAAPAHPPAPAGSDACAARLLTEPPGAAATAAAPETPAAQAAHIAPVAPATPAALNRALPNEHIPRIK